MAASIDRVVVVGAGHAGVQLVDSLRQEGFDGGITLIGEEDTLPYQRPPLSKDFISSGFGAGAEPEALPLRAPTFYADSAVEMRLGERVVKVDRDRSEVVLGSDVGAAERIPYDRLVLATGAENRTHTIPGADAAGVFGLRTLADAKALRTGLDSARRVVVVGAGFIGLEFAAAARERGLKVTVLESADRPMARTLTRVLGEWIADAHRRMGTELRFGASVTAFEVDAAGRIAGVRTQNGDLYAADLVLCGIGVVPRVALAEAAGLHVRNGIVVDQSLRTSDPEIFAIGDCASFPYSAARLRLESVQNSSEHARHAARALLSGDNTLFDALPVFWSHQGKLKLQIAGLFEPGDSTEIVGDAASDKFSVRCYRDGSLVAVESINEPRVHLAAKHELAAGDPPG